MSTQSPRQKLYDELGRQLVNTLPAYKDMIIEAAVNAAESLGVRLKPKKRRRIKPAPTIDMFPEKPSSRKEDKHGEIKQ